MDEILKVCIPYPVYSNYFVTVPFEFAMSVIE